MFNYSEVGKGNTKYLRLQEVRHEKLNDILYRGKGKVMYFLSES